MTGLKEKYKKEVAPAMVKKFSYKSVMAVPKIEKIVVNAGFGKIITPKTSAEQERTCNSIIGDLALICGQKPVLRKAKKSISTFKLRQGMPIGAVVTLRKTKMYDFMGKIINLVLPRSRDFRGIEEKSFDKEGNLTIAFKEHTVFPEISPEKSKVEFGMEITFATTAKSNKEGVELLKLMGFPIK
jgi:large subunit ribosomal protein L5